MSLSCVFPISREPSLLFSVLFYPRMISMQLKLPLDTQTLSLSFWTCSTNNNQLLSNKKTHSNCKRFRFLLFVFVCLFFSLVFYWLGKCRYVSCLLSFLGVALLWKAHKGLNDFSKESDDSECLVNIVLCDCNLTQNIP